ncbi:MAG: hypothetical protein KAT68_19485 [Bacteroidales bacterium]|nr:hypothetical protein [Bacteroidales bacterium]
MKALKTILSIAILAFLLFLVVFLSPRFDHGYYDIQFTLNSNINNQYEMGEVKKILLQRLDNYGISKRKIKLETFDDSINLKINSIKITDIKILERIKNVLTLQGNKIELWETYQFCELGQNFLDANEYLSNRNKNNPNTAKIDEGKPEETQETTDEYSLLDDIEMTEAETDSYDSIEMEYPLYSVISPNTDEKGNFNCEATFGYSIINDTAKVKEYLSETSNLFPSDIKFAWTNTRVGDETIYLGLIALKASISGEIKPILGRETITHFHLDRKSDGTMGISLSMNTAGIKKLEQLFTNIKNEEKKQIAVVIDDIVYSVPDINKALEKGKFFFSNNFTKEDARDLTVVIESPLHPYKLEISGEQIEGNMRFSNVNQKIVYGIRDGALTGLLTLLIILLITFSPSKKYCPDCNTKLPILRKTKSINQFFSGGHTCPNCGKVMNRKDPVKHGENTVRKIDKISRFEKFLFIGVLFFTAIGIVLKITGHLTGEDLQYQMAIIISCLLVIGLIVYYLIKSKPTIYKLIFIFLIAKTISKISILTPGPPPFFVLLALFGWISNILIIWILIKASLSTVNKKSIELTLYFVVSCILAAQVILPFTGNLVIALKLNYVLLPTILILKLSRVNLKLQDRRFLTILLLLAVFQIVAGFSKFI